jgi:hypothetical protein
MKCTNCNGSGKTNIHGSHYGEECFECRGVGRLPNDTVQPGSLIASPLTDRQKYDQLVDRYTELAMKYAELADRYAAMIVPVDDPEWADDFKKGGSA